MIMNKSPFMFSPYVKHVNDEVERVLIPSEDVALKRQNVNQIQHEAA